MKLKDVIPDKVYKILVYLYDRFFNSFKNDSYSQEGENLVLQRIFSEKKSGFYIDIGAHHPKRFSNTYFFIKRDGEELILSQNRRVKTLLIK